MPRSCAISGRWSARRQHLDRIVRRSRRQSRAGAVHPGQRRDPRAAGGALPRARPARGAGARRGDRRARGRGWARRRKGRPGRQHAMDEAYFARVEAIQFTIAHDDGIALGGLGGSRHRARRGVAHVEDADQHLPRQPRLQGRQYPAGGRKPAAAGAVRLAPSAGGRPDHRARAADPGPPQPPAVARTRRPRPPMSMPSGSTREVAFARRMFADNGWPVIDVTRRSIEETAAAVINLLQRTRSAPATAVGPRRDMTSRYDDRAGFAERLAPGDARGRGRGVRRASRRDIDERALEARLGGGPPAAIALALAEAKALAVRAAPARWCWAAIRWSRSTGRRFDKPASRDEAAEHLRFFSGRTMRAAPRRRAGARRRDRLASRRSRAAARARAVGGFHRRLSRRRMARGRRLRRGVPHRGARACSCSSGSRAIISPCSGCRCCRCSARCASSASCRA